MFMGMFITSYNPKLDRILINVYDMLRYDLMRYDMMLMIDLPTNGDGHPPE